MTSDPADRSGWAPVASVLAREVDDLGDKHAGFVVDKEVPVRMGPFEFTDYVMTKAL